MSDFESIQRYSICVTTSRSPTSTSSNSSNSEAAQILCPHTGSSSSGFSQSNGSALKTGVGVGIHSIATYPCTGYFNTQGLYLVYAGPSKENMNAMLLSSGDDANPNSGAGGTQKWKCRLPEYMEGGLQISPHSPNFVFGGGRSGRAYVWSSFQNGALLKIWQAHYRPITSIAFSSCGGYVLTGGADGIVHIWNYLDLISQSNSSADDLIQNDEINPIHTWSEHSLPISSLCSLPSNRAVSVSLDRQLIIMELFNGKTIARILLPSAITCVTSDQDAHRLYAGAINGTIYCIDLDTYAISTTAESATVVSQKAHTRSSSSIYSTSGTRLLESVLHGQQSSQTNNNSINDTTISTSSYISEFRGHEKKVTSLTILGGGASTASSNVKDGSNDIVNGDLLVSGGEDGTVRIWDIRAWCCTSIMRPWAATSSNNSASEATKSKEIVCPVSSIVAIPHQVSNTSMSSTNLDKFGKDGNIFSVGIFSGKNQSANDASSLIRPLQRFQQRRQSSSNLRNEESCDSVPIITASLKNDSSFQFWEGNSLFDKKSAYYNVDNEHRAKRFRLSCSLSSGKVDRFSTSCTDKVGTTSENDKDMAEKDSIIVKSDEEVQRLRKELEEANSVIERWQKVNSKLVKKLKKLESKK